MRRSTGTLAMGLLAAILVPGCAYVGMVKQRRALRSELEDRPTVSAVRALAPENCSVVIGKLVGSTGPREPVLMLALSSAHVENEVVASRALVPTPEGNFGFFAPEGDYDVLILADLDRNGRFDSGEVVGRTPSGRRFHVDPTLAKRELFVPGPEIRVDPKSPSSAPVPVDVPAKVAGNVFASLADPIFDPAMGETGVYDPAKFLTRTQGFFFGLEPLDPKKTIVLFVHGILGTPRDFEFLAAGLDRTRYQPWFYYYPSGFPLDRSGALLSTLLEYVAARESESSPSIILVAHSMGGLVSRRALNDLCAKGRPEWLRGYVSFVSPYGGTESAKKGLKAPEVVASWKDVAAESEFVDRVHAQALPATLPWHLFFGWGNEKESGPGPSGDGTIELWSQLDRRAQKAAARLHGYPETHVGILQNESARGEFLAVIDGLAGNKAR